MELYFGERERRGLELTGTPGLGLGERRSSFGKAGVEPGMGLGERRQSFGKAGVTPPGGFRERRGSISSLSGKEELTDYHHRQKEERLREQEVERLVSVFAHVGLTSGLKMFLMSAASANSNYGNIVSFGSHYTV